MSARYVAVCPDGTEYVRRESRAKAEYDADWLSAPGACCGSRAHTVEVVNDAGADQ